MGGGSRGGGGMALYKWSFGHQQKLSGLFWVKYRQQNKCVSDCLYSLSGFSYLFIISDLKGIELYLLGCSDNFIKTFKKKKAENVYHIS